MARRGRSGSGTDAGREGAGRRREPMTAARARRLIGVATAVAPLVAPYALAVAGVARGRWDAYRAARLGVTPQQLTAYSGRGGALHARIDRIAEALRTLEGGEPPASDESRRFAAASRPRLVDLALAVRAAEQMPGPRRRTAHRAIGGELDRIEVELLTRLGVLGPVAP
jgi:Family of unknown function (DUF6474)